MRKLAAVALGGSWIVALACSSTPAGSDGGTDASNDVATGNDAATDSGGGDAGSTFSLKINDYLNWCNVTVNDGGVSTADPQTFAFAPNTVVNLSGDTAASLSFVWGYWAGTAGDLDAGHDKNKVTTVTMTGDKLIQACCPLVGSPNTPCPAPQ